MHGAKIVDAAAKLEEQRRRNRLAQRRRRESKFMPTPLLLQPADQFLYIMQLYMQTKRLNEGTSLGQRNRAASVNTDPLSIISPDGQNQEPSEKTWNFAADGDFFDPFLEEQDCIADQCHQHYTTVTNTAELATEQATTAEPISPAAKPNANEKGISEPQLVSSNANSSSARLASSPTSPLHQFLLTLQNGRQTGHNCTDALMLKLSQNYLKTRAVDC